MANIWKTLGLNEPTDDLKAIKRAYAKKLRATRPDDDPEGFMALREALEQASYHANYQADLKTRQKIPHTDPSAADTRPKDEALAPSNEIKPEAASELSSEAKAPETNIIDPTPEPEKPDSAPMLDDVANLIKDPFGRSDIQQWNKLFNDPRLEGIDASIDFEDHFRNYLLDILGYFDGDTDRHNMNRKPKLFTTRVGNHIFRSMGWRDMQGRPFYVQDQLDWLRRDLDVIDRSKPAHLRQQNQQLDVIHTDVEGGISAWKIAVGLVILVNLIRLIIENAG